MSQKMKVKIRVGPHKGQIFEGEYKWVDPNTNGVTIPELNDEFFWAGSYAGPNSTENGNCLNAEYENLWAPYYTDHNGGGEICVGDEVLFSSGNIIRFGVVVKIIPKGYRGGITTVSKVSIREFVYNQTRTFLNLDGIVKIENINGIVEKLKAETNP